jgi:hypothetical protein
MSKYNRNIVPPMTRRDGPVFHWLYSGSRLLACEFRVLALELGPYSASEPHGGLDLDFAY